MNVVIDTNVLVSALWKPVGNASMVLSNVISGRLTPCYDERIMDEYADVLMRPKFKFSPMQVKCILDVFVHNGISVVPYPLPDVEMRNEDDRAFYEVAKHCNAVLVSGNTRHFPADPLVMNLAEFCLLYLREVEP